MSQIVRNSDIVKLRSEMDHLYKTVYQGNGKPSIVNQITSIEHRLDSLEEKLETSFKAMDTEMGLKFDRITDVVNERFTHISYQITNEFEAKKTHASGKYQFITGITTAAIATVTTFGALFISHFLKLTGH